jgi:hypothetical protein
LVPVEAAISHPTGPGFACSSILGHLTCTPAGFVNKPTNVGF